MQIDLYLLKTVEITELTYVQLDMVTLYLKLHIEISWRELVYITAMKAVMQMGTSSFEKKKKEILTCG